MDLLERVDSSGVSAVERARRTAYHDAPRRGGKEEIVKIACSIWGGGGKGDDRGSRSGVTEIAFVAPGGGEKKGEGNEREYLVH